MESERCRLIAQQAKRRSRQVASGTNSTRSISDEKALTVSTIWKFPLINLNKKILLIRTSRDNDNMIYWNTLVRISV